MNNFRNVLFSFFVLIMFISALEGISRVYKVFKPRLNEYESQMEQQGITPTNKKPNEKRVVLIGESAAKGVPYSYETSMAGYVQKLLNDSGNKNIRVINTAIPGRHSFYQREQRSSLIRYKTDAVIIYAGNNDTRDFSNVIRDVPFADIDFFLTWNSNFYAGFKRRIVKMQQSINKHSHSKVFSINYNQDDVWHWTDTYLKKKRHYLEDPSLGMKRKIQAIQDYENNLSDLVGSLRKKNITVFVADLPIVHEATPAIQDWSRKGYQFEQKIIFRNSSDESKWRQFYQKGQESLTKKDYAAALSFFNQAAEIDSSFPMLFHFKGITLKGLERYDEARQAYIKSKDLQIQSSAGDSFKSAALRSIIKRFNTFHIETQKALEAVAPHGILGENLFLDHCHPNTLGHKVIAASIMAELCKSRYALCSAPSAADSAYWLQQLEGGKIDEKTLAQEYLLTGFYDFNGTAWDPLPHFDRAVVYLEKAKEIIPENKNIYPLLAAAYFKLGQKDRASDSLKKLIDLDPQEFAKTIKDFPYLEELGVR